MSRDNSLMISVALPLVLGAAACNRAPTPGVERGAAVFATCVPCHGADGAGNETLGAPNIAGLPKWYVQAELEKFQTSQRGAHPFDTVGLRMRSMSLAIDLPGDLESLADYVSTLPRNPAPETLKGNALAGQATYQTCAACHGPDAHGNQSVGAPPLVGQADWYLVAQLEKFKKGWRGTDTRDIPGGTMRPMSLGLDASAMANVVAYIQTLK
jgi:cytochrome c553